MDQKLDQCTPFNKPFHPRINNLLTLRQSYNKMPVANPSKYDGRQSPLNYEQSHRIFYRDLTKTKAIHSNKKPLPFKTLLDKVKELNQPSGAPYVPPHSFHSIRTRHKINNDKLDNKNLFLSKAVRQQEVKEGKFLIDGKVTVGKVKFAQNKKNPMLAPIFTLSDPSRQTSSPKVRLSASFKKTSSQSSRTGPYSQGIRGNSLHRLPNFADKLRGYGYVFGKTLGTRRRYSENLQTLKARLKKSRSQGDFGPRLFMPKVRFRKAVRLIILLLRAIFTTRERIQRQEKERKLSMCLNLSDPHMTSKRAYETYGISFDPLDFKANRQIQVTPEARSVLSMDPSERTPQQLRAVLVSLRQAVPEFSEFPINMQQSLARVGRYERFSAKRVIIRQGHLADNFYFILSGTAVVILLEIDKLTEEQKARTAAVLGRGKSFGELALMHKARRSATVTCRDDVELLSVGREDFVDIFMHVDRGVEPEHIRFLKKLPMLRGWPLHVLPNDNPKVLLFTYVRRGVVLCRDSNSSEWIFIIKSGSCRIIKALAALPANKIKRATPASTKPRVNTPIRPRSCHTSKSLTRIEEESSITDDDRSSFYSGDTDDRDLRLSGGRRDRASSAHGRRDDDDKKSGLQYIQSLDAIIDQKHQYNADSNDEPEKDLQEELNSERSTKPCIFVQVLKLGPKDIYGLESSVFNNMKKTVSTSLVSDGAEMIMIKRKFFMDNTSSELKKRMIKEIHPLPTEESLQNQLQNRVEWESYRTLTLQKTMADMRLIETHSPRR